MADIDTIIAAVKRLDAEATKGPWNAGLGCVYENDGFSAGDPDAPDTRIAQANDKDCELIAYYRTAAPALASEVERLHEEVERLTRDRERLAGYVRAAIAESLDATRAIAAQRDAALTERDEARRELAAAEESARMYAERGLRWERELLKVRALVEEHRKRRAASLIGQWSTYGDGACDALDSLSAEIDALGKEQGNE